MKCKLLFLNGKYGDNISYKLEKSIEIVQPGILTKDLIFGISIKLARLSNIQLGVISSKFAKSHEPKYQKSN